MASGSESDESFEGFDENDLANLDHDFNDAGSDISVSSVSSGDISDLGDTSNSEEEVDREWSEHVRNVVVPEFTAGFGPTFVLDQNARELDFFKKFFPECLMEHLVRETNAYARKQIQNKPDPKWRDTNLAEMQAFLGIHVVFSVMQIPEYRIGWNTELYYGIQGIPDIMTRDRFERLGKYFHLNDTTNNPARGQAGHDKLCHIRPILNTVLEKCLGNYNPPRDQSIDEGMIAFKGRLSFRQYLPAKPTKFGVKVWERASPRSGYVHEFQVYVGREQGRVGGEQGLGTRVVKDLTRAITNKHHHVYMDNFFSSPALFNNLKRDRIYCCGTVRSNRRGIPERMKNPRLNRGQSQTMQKDTLSVTVWKDKKNVHFLYNNMTPGAEVAVPRRERNGQRQQINSPQVARVYSQNKLGVDLADQIRMQYSTCHKAKKWWKYLFWFLFDIALCNSFLVMKESPNHCLRSRNNRVHQRKQLEFRMKLGTQLISGFRGTRKRQAPSNIDIEGNRHWPVPFEKRGRCKMCSENNRRHEVTIGCEICKVRLCVDRGCFKSYHVRLQSGQ